MSVVVALLLAQSLTADDAMAAHRRALDVVLDPCPAGPDPDVVVVCADRENRRYRAPRDTHRTPINARIAGEPRPADLGATPGACGVVGGHPHGCGGAIDYIGLAIKTVQLVVRALDPTDPIAPPVPREVVD